MPLWFLLCALKKYTQYKLLVSQLKLFNPPGIAGGINNSVLHVSAGNKQSEPPIEIDELH
jgi:hypothetical protein